MAETQTRKRTESLSKMYAKKPISEGYSLWDREYLLAAMRVFTFKAEGAPPFVLAPYLDSVAEITLQMHDLEDAAEQFAIAAGKYQLIDQKVLADLMRFKVTEVSSSAEIALEQVQAYLAAQDPQRSGGGDGATAQTKSAFARVYAYLADLLLGSLDEEKTSGAVLTQARAAAELAVQLGWDRDHCGWLVVGDVYAASGDYEKSKEAYGKALQKCPHYAKALERQIGVLQQLVRAADERGDGDGKAALNAELLALLTRSIDVHPLANTFREKAFLLSEMQGDEVALAFVSEMLEHPPQEEIDVVGSSSKETTATLLKAKAAILADGDQLDAALAAATKALEVNPNDDEAKSIISDLHESMAA
ncbi:Tetratricopeptide repeat [Novymonas esmeraldas]|uniref:Tetratricopeptide repeat n=1 Tax=Novymonas esmeraldas TaxID=1808958 RepID=A0AAW0F8T5_9TRYP